MDSTSEIGPLISEAGASGNLEKLKAIKRKFVDDREFRSICDVYSDFSTGWTVLHHAAEMGHFEICKFLIKTVGVFIDALTYKRDTPLMLAVKEEHLKIVEYLIIKGATISMANSKGSTALNYAVLKDNWELTELLVIKGARVDTDSVDGTPLQIAVSRGNVEAVKFLLSHGAKPNLCYFVLESPLACAIKAHSLECMNLLLKAQADPNFFFTGFSPLSYAAKESDTRFLKTLLEAGADPNSPITGHVKFIEDAALALNREGVEILFPHTEPIKHYPNWSVDGIMEYCHSEEAQIEREEDKSFCLDALDKSGQVAVGLKHYSRATVHFRIANHLDPSNPKWASKRSLCNAHAGRRLHAMYEAEECFRLEPRFPVPHHGDADAADQIFQKFFLGSLAFTMDPCDNEIHDAFRADFFDYFAWLYLKSSPDEILSFNEES